MPVSKHAIVYTAAGAYAVFLAVMFSQIVAVHRTLDRMNDDLDRAGREVDTVAAALALRFASVAAAAGQARIERENLRVWINPGGEESPEPGTKSNVIAFDFAAGTFCYTQPGSAPSCASLDTMAPDHRPILRHIACTLAEEQGSGNFLEKHCRPPQP